MISATAEPLPSVASLYRSIWRFAEGARATMLASTALLLGSTAIKLSVPWLTAQAINALQRATGSVSQAALWVAAVAGVSAAAWVLHGPGRVLERSVGVRVRERAARAMLLKLSEAPLAWHERHHSGEMQNRIAQSGRALQEFAQSQFIYLQSAVNFIGPLVALALLSAEVGGLALGGYVVVGFLVLRFDRVLIVLTRRQNDAERRYAAGLLDFIGNISTVLSLRLQNSSQRLVGQRLEAVFAPLKRAIVLNEAKWCTADLMGVVLTWSLVATYVGQARGRGETLLIGSIFMIHQYAQQAGSVLGSMAANFQGFAKARTDYASADLIWNAPRKRVATTTVGDSWQRIDIIDLCHEHSSGHPADAALTASPTATAEPAAAATEARPGGLRHVSLALHRGERLALVGPSGSGKSTLMRALAGLYEAQAGHFEIDGVARLGLRDLGSIATLIPQEADVFESTVRENITFGESSDDIALHAALHTGAFDGVLATLPQGLETPISERGFNLSGGQRQRLCLARGLYAARASSLLLLDEPTSALDPTAEAQVHERLNARFGDACIVASVHRMSLLGHFDRVVLMVDGQVVDSGTAAELKQRQPVFRDMLQRQLPFASAGEGAGGDADARRLRPVSAEAAVNA